MARKQLWPEERGKRALQVTFTLKHNDSKASVTLLTVPHAPCLLTQCLVFLILRLSFLVQFRSLLAALTITPHKSTISTPYL